MPSAPLPSVPLRARRQRPQRGDRASGGGSARARSEPHGASGEPPGPKGTPGSRWEPLGPEQSPPGPTGTPQRRQPALG